MKWMRIKKIFCHVVKKLSDVQSNDSFYSTILKLINDNMVSSDEYVKSESRYLLKVLRDDEKLCHALVVPIFSKYVLYQALDALGQHGTARTYQCLE